jgi:hypothetical protein
MLLIRCQPRTGILSSGAQQLLLLHSAVQVRQLLRHLPDTDNLNQGCPTFLCTRTQFTDAYGGTGATTLLLLLLNTTISTT